MSSSAWREVALLLSILSIVTNNQSHSEFSRPPLRLRVPSTESRIRTEPHQLRSCKTVEPMWSAGCSESSKAEGDHALILMEVLDAECRAPVKPLTIQESLRNMADRARSAAEARASACKAGTSNSAFPVGGLTKAAKRRYEDGDKPWRYKRCGIAHPPVKLCCNPTKLRAWRPASLLQQSA
jgi:hypothetical protein